MNIYSRPVKAREQIASDFRKYPSKLRMFIIIDGIAYYLSEFKIKENN